MIMKIFCSDGSWFVGRRGWKEMGCLYIHESKGTHHFTVLEGDDFFTPLVGREVAIPIDRVKCFVLNYKRSV